ncbi:uncharacterized protein LOC144099203 isoform X1 [Amblyomma americanum]
MNSRGHSLYVLLALVLPTECVLPENSQREDSSRPVPPDQIPIHAPGSPPRFPSRFLLGAHEGDTPPGLPGHVPIFHRGNPLQQAYVPRPAAAPGPRPHLRQAPQAPQGPRQQPPGARPRHQDGGNPPLQGARPPRAPGERPQPPQSPRNEQPQGAMAPPLLNPGPQPPPDPMPLNPRGSPSRFPQRHLLGNGAGEIPPGLLGHNPASAQVPRPQNPQGHRQNDAEGERLQSPQRPAPQQPRDSRNLPPQGRAPQQHQIPLQSLGNQPPQGPRPQPPQNSRANLPEVRGASAPVGVRPQPPQDPRRQSSQEFRQGARLGAAHIIQPNTQQLIRPEPPHGFWPPRTPAQHTCPVMCRPEQQLGDSCGPPQGCRCGVWYPSPSVWHLHCIFVPSG